MSVIRVRKKPEDLSETEFLREALKELQVEQKAQGKKFTYDIEAWKQARKKAQK